MPIDDIDASPIAETTINSTSSSGEPLVTPVLDLLSPASREERYKLTLDAVSKLKRKPMCRPVSLDMMKAGTPTRLARVHAQALARHLIQQNPGEVLTSEKVVSIYQDMCHALHVGPRPENPVLRELSLLIKLRGRSAKQTQKWIDPTGHETRQRVYKIPKKAKR